MMKIETAANYLPLLEVALEGERMTACAYPQLKFKPKGLALFGVQEGTMLHELRLGNVHVLMAPESMPARWFDAGPYVKSFEQLAGLQKVEQIEELIPLSRRWDMPAMLPGHMATLVFSGRIEQAMLWGVSPDADYSTCKHEAVIKHFDGGFSGEVVEHNFMGSETVFQASGPTDSSVALMLSHYIEGRARKNLY